MLGSLGGKAIALSEESSITLFTPVREVYEVRGPCKTIIPCWKSSVSITRSVYGNAPRLVK